MRPLVIGLALLLPLGRVSAAPHPWPQGASSQTLSSRVPPPGGYKRLSAPEGGFAAWLRTLPLKPGRPVVLLHNGKPKARQDVHHAVLDIDVGKRDLQQCADAVMRLRGEYLRASGRKVEIDFRLADDRRLVWVDWAKGDEGYLNFRKFMDVVFNRANTVALGREMVPVTDRKGILPGDVFVKGGYPGHAILVMDVAENRGGKRVFLLAQSYMPAQEMHILRNPDSPLDPWYEVGEGDDFWTPEWEFKWSHLKRFANP